MSNKNLKVNFNNKSIQISEAFSKKAGIPNTPAYTELQKIISSFPDYKIEVVSKQKNKNPIIKGINIDFLRKYVESHNEDGFLDEFNKLVENKLSFLQLRNEFIKHYPAFENYKTRAEWLLAK